MNPNKAKKFSKSVTQAALEFLAAKYNVTVPAIVEGIRLNRGKLEGQFLLLLKAGNEQAANLAH